MTMKNNLRIFDADAFEWARDKRLTYSDNKDNKKVKTYSLFRVEVLACGSGEVIVVMPKTSESISDNSTYLISPSSRQNNVCARRYCLFLAQSKDALCRKCESCFVSFY